MSGEMELPDPRPGETPEARTIRLMRTDPELLDATAFNLFEHESRLWDGRARWAALSGQQRQEWREKAIAAVESYTDMSPAQREWHDRVSWATTLEINDAALARIQRGEKP